VSINKVVLEKYTTTSKWWRRLGNAYEVKVDNGVFVCVIHKCECLRGCFMIRLSTNAHLYLYLFILQTIIFSFSDSFTIVWCYVNLTD